MDSDEYELIDKQELSKLRKSQSASRVVRTESSETLIDAMDRLADHMAHLINIFETANKEMYNDYQQGFHDESEKLNKLIEQNEKIARGVLAVADLVNHKQPATKPLPEAPKSDPKKETAKDKGAYPLEEPPSHRRIVREFR